MTLLIGPLVTSLHTTGERGDLSGSDLCDISDTYRNYIKFNRNLVSYQGA